jgi:hypothetical protein
LLFSNEALERNLGAYGFRNLKASSRIRRKCVEEFGKVSGQG